MTTASTPGHIDKSRSQIVHAVHTIVEILYTLSCLGWEELEGKGWFSLGGAGRQLLGDMHGRTGMPALFDDPVGISVCTGCFWSKGGH